MKSQIRISAKLQSLTTNLRKSEAFTSSGIARPKAVRGVLARARFPTGFTLIEVVMVLGISVLLTMVLFSAYGGQQRRARFTDSVEAVVASLEKIKSEVSSGFTSSMGSTPDRIFFGKAVKFSPGSSNYTVEVLTAPDSEQLIPPINVQAPITLRIPWGATYAGGADDYRTIVFARSLITGFLVTYVLPGSADITDPAVYNDSAAQAVLPFTNPDSGFQATVTVKEAASEVTRNYE